MKLPFSYQENVLLKDFSTFGIGGPATFFSVPKSVEEMQVIINFCYQKGLRYFILGKGSNCLFDDRGFDGLVILNGIDYLIQKDNLFSAGAGYSFARLGKQTARLGFSGLEFASGIPATVGGAVFMNAGANQQETFTHLKKVLFLSEQGDLKIFEKDQLVYSYRSSIFQKNKGIIIEAEFELDPNEQAKEFQKKNLDYRLKTQPYKDKSAGCVFRNCEKGAAGALIDQAGLKGFRVGGIEVSQMHANFIVNKDQGKASEVLELIKTIKEKIHEIHGVELEEEIRWVPYK